jgi:Ca2+-binding EF-hand superfamily protein
MRAKVAGNNRPTLFRSIHDMNGLIMAGAAALALAGTAAAQAPGTAAAQAPATSAAPAAAPGDGSIRRADATAMVDQIFARVDLNSDGRITRDEMQAARQQFAQSRPGGAAGGQAPAAGGGGGGMGMFAALGALGTITLEQARAMALAHFDGMDADGDGTVTRAERQAARESRNRMMEEGMGGARPRPKARQ